MLSCASVYWCLVVSWERADLLALVVMSNCEVVHFPIGILVRCGAGLYRFLIFALFLLYLWNRRRADEKLNHRNRDKLQNGRSQNVDLMTSQIMCFAPPPPPPVVFNFSNESDYDQEDCRPTHRTIMKRLNTDSHNTIKIKQLGLSSSTKWLLN